MFSYPWARQTFFLELQGQKSGYFAWLPQVGGSFTFGWLKQLGILNFSRLQTLNP